MADGNAVTAAGTKYAVAYAAHTQAKKLREAIGLYRGVMVDHPDSPEAGYSQSQIQNIASSVVSKQEILDAQADLALAQLARQE